MINKNRQKRKKGVSEVVGYVILISIAMGIALGVYAYLRLLPDSVKPPIDCKEGTSVILDGYTCTPNSPLSVGNIVLTIKNNGRFNVNGVIVAVGDDPDKTPVTYLKPKGGGSIERGNFKFIASLDPGSDNTVSFHFIEINPNGAETNIVAPYEVKTIQIQPYIMDGTDKIVCTNTIFTDDRIQGCSA